MSESIKVNPLELLKELEHLESEALRTQEPVRKYMLLQGRHEVLELLVALMALTGFRCEKLDRIVATEPQVQQMLAEYTNHSDDDVPANMASRPRGLR